MLRAHTPVLLERARAWPGGASGQGGEPSLAILTLLSETERLVWMGRSTMTALLHCTQNRGQNSSHAPTRTHPVTTAPMRHRCGFAHPAICCRPSHNHRQEALTDDPLRVSLIVNSHCPNTHYLSQGPNGFGYIFRTTLSFRDSARGCQSLPIQTQDYFTMK